MSMLILWVSCVMFYIICINICLYNSRGFLKGIYILNNNIIMIMINKSKVFWNVENFK